MPQNSYFLIKKRIKKSKNFKFRAVLFSILFAIVFLTLILNLSDFFSSLITNSGSLFSSKKLEFSSYNVYAVSIIDYDNEIQANQAASQVASQGGAGVVYHSGEYFVLTSSYPTLAYAQEVSENLKALGHNSRIVSLNVDGILCEYKGKNSSLFLSCFQIFKSCYNKLYDLSLLLDKQQIDYVEVNSNIMLKLKQIETLKNDLKNLNTDADKTLKEICIEKLSSLENILNEGVRSVNFGNNYTANLKQVLIKIIVLNQEFVNQIKS